VNEMKNKADKISRKIGSLKRANNDWTFFRILGNSIGNINVPTIAKVKQKGFLSTKSWGKIAIYADLILKYFYNAISQICVPVREVCCYATTQLRTRKIYSPQNSNPRWKTGSKLNKSRKIESGYLFSNKSCNFWIGVHYCVQFLYYVITINNIKLYIKEFCDNHIWSLHYRLLRYTILTKSRDMVWHWTFNFKHHYQSKQAKFL
jgi:hypothetical protein